MAHDIKTLIKEVLEKGYLMSLGTMDEGGVWVSDVIYIFDEDFNLYWMSDPDCRHSKAVLKNPNVAGTITVNLPKENMQSIFWALVRKWNIISSLKIFHFLSRYQNNLGIQFEGVAEKIEGARYDLAKKHYAKRKKPEPKETDNVLQGDFWYMLKPKKIELICEEFFGFEKQKIEL